MLVDILTINDKAVNMRKKSHSIQRKRLINQQKQKISARRHVQFIQENQSIAK